MFGVADLIFNADNLRMLVILAFGYCGYLHIKGQIKGTEHKFEKIIDEKLLAFHAQLKANDFAHLNATIEALTFILEKNGFLKIEDKQYIDSRLDKG